MHGRMFIGVVAMLLASPCLAAEPSRFLAEYPAAVQALRAATENISCTGTFKRHDSEGAIRFCKMGGEGSWALKHFDATKTTVAWSRRVESFSPDWVFVLEGKEKDSPLEFKGVEYFESIPKKFADRIASRRWLRCNSFTCSLYSINGTMVSDLVKLPGFAIESEGVLGGDGVYEVLFTCSEAVPGLGAPLLKSRLQFDPMMSWALVAYDLVAGDTGGGDDVGYYFGRLQPERLADGSIVPKRVELRGGSLTEGRSTVLGAPKWSEGSVFEVATFDKVVVGKVTEKDFLPASFGLGDHLVLGTPPKAESSRWLLISGAAVAVVAILVWVVFRRRAAAGG